MEVIASIYLTLSPLNLAAWCITAGDTVIAAVYTVNGGKKCFWIKSYQINLVVHITTIHPALLVCVHIHHIQTFRFFKFNHYTLNQKINWIKSFFFLGDNYLILIWFVFLNKFYGLCMIIWLEKKTEALGSMRILHEYLHII